MAYKIETTWPQAVKIIGEREVCREKKSFVSQNLCLYYRYLYGLIKEKKAEGLIFDFWVLNGTIRMSYKIHV